LTIGLFADYPTDRRLGTRLNGRTLNIKNLASRAGWLLVINPARKQQKKAHTTSEDYDRIVNKRLIPRFG
jgi:hypothetical protein